jgi:hypothetical protein
MDNKRKSKFDQINEEIYEVKVPERQDINSSFITDINTLNNQQMQLKVDNIKEYFTPETIPVGILATMVKDQITRNKESNRPFVPYQHLDINYTPNIYINQAPSQTALTKLDNFYKFYEKIK